MDPYWIGGTLKAPAVQKKRQATPRRKHPIASAQHSEAAAKSDLGNLVSLGAMLWFAASMSAARAYLLTLAGR